MTRIDHGHRALINEQLAFQKQVNYSAKATNFYV
jgi:hypothetical protein